MATVLQFPQQQPPRQREYASAPESAKLLKAALRAAFPATRFSVTLDRGTAYGCANVRWTDGPSTKLVDAVVGPFSGEGFDSMTDCSFHINTTLADGRRSGLRLISTNRHVSVTLARKAAAQVATFYGLELPTITETEGGFWRVENDGRWVREDIREYWSTLIHQAASDHSRFSSEGR